MTVNFKCALTRLSLTALLLPSLFPQSAISNPQSPQDPKKDDRGLGVQAPSPTPTPGQAAGGSQQAAGQKPEIVLQAGITSPQTQISFSPDGRLLASMGIGGNAIKLWEVASGRLVRQLESSIPAMGASSMSRPFRFSADGKTLTAFADGRLQRWDVETGREISNAVLTTAKDLFYVFLSNDGSTIAAINPATDAVRLWDAVTGRELRAVSFAEEEQLIQNSVALSADGKLLAALTERVSASMSAIEKKRQVTIFEVATGRKTQTIDLKSTKTQFTVLNQPPSYHSVTLGFAGNANDLWLAVRDDESMRVFDANSGRELKTIPAQSTVPADPSLEMFASQFLFSRNRQILSLVTDRTRVKVIDVGSGNTLHTLSGHDNPQAIVGVSFSDDGKLLASSATDNQIKLWDVTTGREVKTLSGAAMPITDIAFSADGRSLTLAGPQAVSSWELTTGGVRRAVTLPDDYSRAGLEGMSERGSVLSSDGKLVVAGSNNQPVAKVWEVSTGRELPSVPLTPGKELRSAAFTRDATVVALVEGNNKKLAPQASQPAPSIPIATPNPKAQPNKNKMPTMADLSNMPGMPDMSKMMEMMKKDPKKLQEELKKTQEAMEKGDLTAGMEMMEKMGMMPGAKSNQPTNSLRLVEVSSGRALQTIPLPGGFLSATMDNSMMGGSTLAFSPDGRMLASSSGYTAPLMLRDATTGQELRRLKSLNSMTVNTVAWSPDSKRLASAHFGFKKNMMDPSAANDFSFEDMSFAIKLWDAQTGTELSSLAGHNNFINRLAFSRDGRFLASGSYDTTLKLWDLASGRELQTLKGHTGSITALDFSPDGNLVVSGSDDGSARLWTTQTGELLATMVSLNKGADWLVVAPNGLFDGSPGGWNQILWRFSPALFDVSPVEIFFNEYFHPGLLPDIVAGKKPAVAVDISRKDRRQPKVSLDIAAAPGERTAKVKINITDAPAGARDVRLFRNGSLVKVWRGDVLQGQSTAGLETTARVVAGPNQFTAYAFNRDNVKSSDATVSLNGADSLKRPATFHLLVVGINNYANEEYNLKYAVADARGFAAEVEREQRKLGKYQHVEVTSLLDQSATKANLIYALRRLGGFPDAPLPEGAPPELAKIKAAEPEDAVAVYYAGHGTAQNQRFYLIPHDLGYAGKRTELDEPGLASMLAHSISDLELEQEFERIDAGLTLMVIDACNSGQALETEEKRRGPMNSKGLAQLAYEKGMYILTAAQSYQAALEAAQLGHGYLTYVLLEEGLKSVAADNQPKDGQVVLREWLDFATERVPQMQETKMRSTRGVGLEIAFVEGEEKVAEVDKRTLQRPRVFYRREQEAQPLVVAKQ
ncbi:MAG TPA: caspase family protein [Pyrinomonadaceae bacterium]|nr:caspase family protein [Pyrinomonadaceae bacterium]